MSASRYLQMVGRAARGGGGGEGAPTDDAYVLLRPDDVRHFRDMVADHVEPVRSQLLAVPDYYRKGGGDDDATTRPPRRHTGVTRILLGSVLFGDAARDVRLSDAVQVYRTTLLYQQGEEADVGDAVVRYTVRPLLAELLVGVCVCVCERP